MRGAIYLTLLYSQAHGRSKTNFYLSDSEDLEMADIDMPLRVSTNDEDGLLLYDIIQILDVYC